MSELNWLAGFAGVSKQEVKSSFEASFVCSVQISVVSAAIVPAQVIYGLVLCVGVGALHNAAAVMD